PPRGTFTPLDRHPIFEGRTALRDHVLAPLADRPVDRPGTRDLPGWIEQLSVLVRSAGLPDLGLDWSDRAAPVPVNSDGGRVVGRARPVLRGTETDAFHRIELLERELVALRAKAAKLPPQPDLQRMPAFTPPAPEPPSPASVSGGPAAGASA